MGRSRASARRGKNGLRLAKTAVVEITRGTSTPLDRTNALDDESLDLDVAETAEPIADGGSTITPDPVRRDPTASRQVAAGWRGLENDLLRARFETALQDNTRVARPAVADLPPAATRRSFSVGDAPPPSDLVRADTDWSTASEAEVTALQTELTNRGFDPGAVDGLWGPNTEGALTRAREAAPAGDLIGADRDWSRASPTELRSLQTQLRDGGNDPGAIDGIWGPKTEGALQAARGGDAAPDLIASDRDWSTASRDDVTTLQEQLVARGQDPGTVDGIWGPKTEGALTAARTETAPGADPAVEAPVDEEEQFPDLDKLPSDLVLTGEDWTQASPERVTELQTALTDAGIDVGDVDGRWGPSTESGLDYARFAIEHDINRRAIYDRERPIEDVPPSEAIVVDPNQVPEERRAALLERDDWSGAPEEEVRELQTFLSERGYDVGEVDGRWGRQTEGALALAQRRQSLLDGYQGADSFGADVARTLSPLPANMDNLILSKLGMDTAITDGSLADDERLAIYDTALAAMERTGEPVGGTTYADYGREEFDDYFNRGNMTTDAVLSSFDDPQFRMASTLGRFTYMQDPEDPNRLFVFDGYDWNVGENDFDVDAAEGDTAARYRELRNDMRQMERTEGPSDRDNRVFLIFDRAQMEAMRAELGDG